jgi:hypothetical protein
MGYALRCSLDFLCACCQAEDMMLRIDRQARTLQPLRDTTLSAASITEVGDLQQFILNCPESFFAEIGQDLFVIGHEVQPSETVADRIDILAVDREGTATVIELKRGNHKLHLLQAISYAAMISTWTPEDFLGHLDQARQEALADFLNEDVDNLGRSQRLLLVAEEYDYALLASAEWLIEKYGMDVLCCRVAMSQDPDTEAEYLLCSNVLPAPELAEQAIRRGRRVAATQSSSPPNWDAVLAKITVPVVREFFAGELAAGRNEYLPSRILIYSSGGHQRWHVSARTKKGYVYQIGRFPGDIELWKKKMSEPDEVVEVRDGLRIRFFLYTSSDFQNFRTFVTGEGQAVEWLSSQEIAADDD